MSWILKRLTAALLIACFVADAGFSAPVGTRRLASAQVLCDFQALSSRSRIPYFSNMISRPSGARLGQELRRFRAFSLRALKGTGMAGILAYGVTGASLAQELHKGQFFPHGEAPLLYFSFSIGVILLLLMAGLASIFIGKISAIVENILVVRHARTSGPPLVVPPLDRLELINVIVDQIAGGARPKNLEDRLSALTLLSTLPGGAQRNAALAPTVLFLLESLSYLRFIPVPSEEVHSVRKAAAIALARYLAAGVPTADRNQISARIAHWAVAHPSHDFNYHLAVLLRSGDLTDSAQKHILEAGLFIHEQDYDQIRVLESLVSTIRRRIDQDGMPPAWAPDVRDWVLRLYTAGHDNAFHLLAALRDLPLAAPLVTPEVMGAATQSYAAHQREQHFIPRQVGHMQVTYLGYLPEICPLPPQFDGLNLRRLSLRRSSADDTLLPGFVPGRLQASLGIPLPEAFSDLWVIKEADLARAPRHHVDPALGLYGEWIRLGVSLDGGRAVLANAATGIVLSVCVNVNLTETERIETLAESFAADFQYVKRMTALAQPTDDPLSDPELAAAWRVRELVATMDAYLRQAVIDAIDQRLGADATDRVREILRRPYETVGGLSQRDFTRIGPELIQQIEAYLAEHPTHETERLFRRPTFGDTPAPGLPFVVTPEGYREIGGMLGLADRSPENVTAFLHGLAIAPTLNAYVNLPLSHLLLQTFSHTIFRHPNQELSHWWALKVVSLAIQSGMAQEKPMTISYVQRLLDAALIRADFARSTYGYGLSFSGLVFARSVFEVVYRAHALGRRLKRADFSYVVAGTFLGSLISFGAVAAYGFLSWIAEMIADSHYRFGNTFHAVFGVQHVGAEVLVLSSGLIFVARLIMTDILHDRKPAKRLTFGALLIFSAWLGLTVAGHHKLFPTYTLVTELWSTHSPVVAWAFTGLFIGSVSSLAARAARSVWHWSLHRFRKGQPVIEPLSGLGSILRIVLLAVGAIWSADESNPMVRHREETAWAAIPKAFRHRDVKAVLKQLSDADLNYVVQSPTGLEPNRQAYLSDERVAHLWRQWVEGNETERLNDAGVLSAERLHAVTGLDQLRYSDAADLILEELERRLPTPPRASFSPALARAA